MDAEIITTGTELLLGQIVNTNAQFLAQSLRDMGINCYFQTTVGDNRDRMRQAIENALERSDIVITTGGLGPTQGDITREVMADITGRPLVMDKESYSQITEFFRQRNLDMPETNVRQAMFPEGTTILPNTCGTAPGLLNEWNGKIVINLPGPPREMKVMYQHNVEPFFQQKCGTGARIFVRVLRTFGITESGLEEAIMDYIQSQTNPTLALRATQGEIHIRIAASDEDESKARQLVEQMEKAILERVGEYVFGRDEEKLINVVAERLLNRKLTVATAESCTGGLIAARLTDIQGSSAYFMEGVVCYSNWAKVKRLGVPEEIIQKHGAVSPETALAMAEGIQKLSGANIGVSVTGIAGPGGGTIDKPVGLVYCAICFNGETTVFEYCFKGDRAAIRLRTMLSALNEIRKLVEKH